MKSSLEEYPCEKCDVRSDVGTCTCSRWRVWFTHQWAGIQFSYDEIKRRKAEREAEDDLRRDRGSDERAADAEDGPEDGAVEK